MLYFFRGQRVAIVAVGLAKEGKVPPGEIARAKARRAEIDDAKQPEAHLVRFEGGKP